MLDEEYLFSTDKITLLRCIFYLYSVLWGFAEKGLGLVTSKRVGK